MKTIHPYFWNGRVLRVMEQKDLPRRVRFLPCRTHIDAARAIRNMSVRGAPAIGCVAAFGMALAAREKTFPSLSAMRRYLEKARKTLAATRPTAVNLFWALERMARVRAIAGTGKAAAAALAKALEWEARAIDAEDLAGCKRIGALGAGLLKRNSVVLTHCNAGALATAGHGTALGVIRTAFSQGKIKKVLVDETRPYLQGARLTAWELHQEGIPYEIITDNMAGHLMKTEKISAVVVGADRVAANGDAANKIGTYALSVLAKHHKIPFYVAAPYSTLDLSLSDGGLIPIEERSSDEVLLIGGKPIAPRGARARHPGFDVTPAAHITALVTDRGIARPPTRGSLGRLSRISK